MSRRILVLVLLAGCGNRNDDKPPKPVDPPPPHDDAGKRAEIVLPPAPPVPGVPAGLPAAPEVATITADAVALGELLFWDPRLSRTNRLSCASCHVPAEGFAGSTRQDTALARPNLRRAPALVNLAWHKELAWDGRYGTLAEQLAAHVRGQLGDDLAAVVTRISDVPGYRPHFARFPGTAPAEIAINALGAYVLTRYAGNAPWDRLERSPDATAELKAGYQVFNTRAQCAVCHTPPLYTDLRYHPLGLIAVADDGRGAVEAAQHGAFKTPTLRGAAVREAFFHDASAKTLDAAIDWHLAGGTGQGADPSIIDPALKKVSLTATERAQLGAFVRALTDTSAPVPGKPALP